MKKSKHIFRRIAAVGMSIGISLTGVINIHAEENETTESTSTPTVASTPISSEAPETASPAPKSAVMPTPKSTASPTPETTATTTPNVQPTPSATATPSPTVTPQPTSIPADQNDTSSDNAKEISIYRLYNLSSGEHFYTAVKSESDHLKSLGWRYEGVGWISPSKGRPVYRLYNRYNGEHHYTPNTHERDVLVSKGWRNEGTGWYSDTLQRKAVYREYNPNAFSCNHNFTTGKNEHETLISYGWRNENIAFYAMKEGKTIPYVKPKPKPKPKPAPAREKFYNHGPIPNLKQNDPRWANVRIGGYPMKNTGCMPTSIAMAVSAIKYTTITPVQVARYLHDNTDSFNVINHGGNAKSAELAAKHWGIKWKGLTSANQMADALRHGQLVVMQVGPGDFTAPGYSHAILLAGNSNGITTVYDPDAANRAFNLYRIWNQRTTIPYDLIGGYVGIAMYKN